MNRALEYSSVWLVPKMCIVNSRSECNASVFVAGRKWRVPIIPANMKCTIDFTLARWLATHDYFYILHRFYTYEEIVEWVGKNQDMFISLSLGVKDGDYEFIRTLKDKNFRVDAITIDIAHGHSPAVKNILEHVRKNFPNCFIIAGNVASKQAFIDLAAWGADAVKVGIGGGAACSTKDKTGFTYPMYSCVKFCAEGKKEVKGKVPLLIADGGIKHNGYIAKAIHAGADMVMIGAMMSHCTDSPAESVEVDGKIKKYYFGSASAENKGTTCHVEGFVREFESNGMTYEQKLKEIEEDLQSAISYSGGKNVYDIRNVDCVVT